MDIKAYNPVIRKLSKADFKKWYERGRPDLKDWETQYKILHPKKQKEA